MQVSPRLEAALDKLCFTNFTPLWLTLQWLGRGEDALLIKEVVEVWKEGRLANQEGESPSALHQP